VLIIIPDYYNYYYYVIIIINFLSNDIDEMQIVFAILASMEIQIGL